MSYDQRLANAEREAAVRGREIDEMRAEIERLQSCLYAQESVPALHAEIERLNAELRVAYQLPSAVEHAADAELRAEIERLAAALKPFADAADTLSSFPDDTRLDLAPITLGDLRRARKALEGK